MLHGGLELSFFAILIVGITAAADSLDKDREVLLNLKEFLQQHNRINQGRYSEWNQHTSNPCQWPGISCNGNRVTSVVLSENCISGQIFANFSALTALSHLDLSKNTLGGPIPQDLNQCKSLRYLNLSHNIIDGKLNLSGLNQLEVLDLSVNRINDDIQLSFPGICDKLVVANLSANNFTGTIDKCFDECLNLQYLDLSTNSLSGNLWGGFVRLTEFSASENKLYGNILPSIFSQNCSLQVLDLSENGFVGEVPREISNFQNLVTLDLWGNSLSGRIPSEIGRISSLQTLFLGKNNFSRDIPESLLDLNKLEVLDLSWNRFGGSIQDILGKFKNVKSLGLQGNLYSGGIDTSGILNLPNIFWFDLSFNSFSGSLPVEISKMPSLEFLILAYNQFSGTIPPEYGNLPNLQALDLSFNKLTGPIPPALGNLTSLLWLMLANNKLTGQIPPELGNCSSLLWFNLARNKLSGNFPSELTNIGRNATPVFESNRQKNDQVVSGFGECLAMKRWIPGDYPPFSFVYSTLTRRTCRSVWNKLFEGISNIDSACASSSAAIPVLGHVQLSENNLSGEVPQDIGKMQSFSMLHFGLNKFYGKFPPEVGKLPLAVLNISMNKFSGNIPIEIGNLTSLRSLDLSCNNFSGTFPDSLTNLSKLNVFNVSYNPFLYGRIPSTGQLTTFGKDSYLGDPLLDIPGFEPNPKIVDENPSNLEPIKPNENPKKLTKLTSFWVFVGLTAAFFHIVSFYLSYTYFPRRCFNFFGFATPNCYKYF
ncbi:probable LRR receptor-like serine/threonine-protein kinase At1g74360 [Ziziphus jujuba]|uniref:Probable LRR receptor-like serine/threonine-protein kinase At1g74360 n=1 Tax=Ziziphus jujuba TaxID=326968 RepID=A0ABM3IJP8_ZIZJJ|nr:probable LRR receptor-like serine/threonine-protein kinase At1g74360 [Ziziphus jujuba]